MKNIADLTFADRDEFERKPIAQKLINLLMSDIDISPLVIDGQWGTGKTEFCQKTKNLIKESYEGKLDCAYIDAFQDDHTDDPLIPLIAAIYELIDDESKKIFFLNKAKAILRYGVKASVRAGFAWVLRAEADTLEQNYQEELEKVVNDGSNAVIEGLIKDHQEAKKDIDNLKNILQEITKDKKLIIFIDELDRCKPSFAIAILETIKHVFDVENVKFILVTNYQQMKASVRHCYGSAIDAHRYLDKFIKFKFYLPVEKSFNAKKKHVSFHYAEQLINASLVLKQRGVFADYGFKLLEDLITCNQVSLREVSKIVLYLEIFHTLREKQYDQIWYAVSIFVVFLVYSNPELCEKIRKKEAKAIEICEYLGITTHVKVKEIERRYRSISRDLASLFIITMNDQSVAGYQCDEDDYKEWLEKLNLSTDVDRSELKKHLDDLIIGILDEFQFVKK